MLFALPLLALPALAGSAGTMPDPEYAIAARFAPDFNQIVDRRHRRLDYVTRFDFDGDWQADNNWENAANATIALPAWVYYSVAETRTHFFIHYVLYHPRDWKGNWLTNGALQVVKLVGRPMVFPRWLGLEALSLAHENDLEGVLVVVARDGLQGRADHVVLVESFSHYRFHTFFAPGAAEEFSASGKPLELSGERPVLFVESRGHGVRSQLRPNGHQTVVVYRFTGRAEAPGRSSQAPVGYNLLPLYDTLWEHALEPSRANPTFSKFRLYDKPELSDVFPDGAPRVGTALRGRARGRNRAVAPWGWKNNGIRGQWFFDPARNLAERLHPRRPFATDYLVNRFIALRVGDADRPAAAGSGSR